MIKAPAPPLPQLDDSNRFFWTSGADGVLRILRCDRCEYWVHPPAPICPKCLSTQQTPTAVSGMGTVAAVTINHQAWIPGMQVPFVVAIVELDEQEALRLTTNIVGAAIETVHIGQRVRVTFDHREDVWLPLFTPV